MSRTACTFVAVLVLIIVGGSAHAQEQHNGTASELTEAQTQQAIATALTAAAESTVPLVTIANGDAVFSQVAWPPTQAQAAVYQAARRPATSLTLTVAEFQAAKREEAANNDAALKNRFGLAFRSAMQNGELPKTVLDDLKSALSAYAGPATLKIEGASYTFEVMSTHKDGVSALAGAGGLQQITGIVSALAGPDVPAHFATVVVDDEVANLLGLTAWLKKSPAPALYVPKLDADLTKGATWRFTLCRVDGEDHVMAEVVASVKATEVFTVQNAGKSKPIIGLMAGYDVGDGEYPFYLGPIVHIGGNFSITVGAALGGGNDAAVGYGVAYDISQIFESFTKVMGGNNQQPSGGGDGGSGSQ